LRPSRHSVHRPGERAHGFTSRRTPRIRDADCDLSSLGHGAVAGPRPPTRCRRPSVLDWTPRPIVSACQQTLTRESASWIEVALQRCEGWGECRYRLSATRAASHGVARRFGDSRSKDQDGYVLPSAPCGVSTPFGVIILRTSSRPVSRGSAPHALSFSFRDVSLQPRNAAPAIGLTNETDGDGSPAMQPLLGFGALRHSPGPADPHEGDESLRRRVPRAGFGYPLRDVHHRSSRRAKRRSVHGLDPSRCSPRARAVLLSESMPS
jgi:hypothetical protein